MEKITIADFFKRNDDNILLDVRSPGEYAEGHIPGAVSFPLFTNEERAEVGTLYKKKGHDFAFLKGLEFSPFNSENILGAVPRSGRNGDCRKAEAAAHCTAFDHHQRSSNRS